MSTDDKWKLAEARGSLRRKCASENERNGHVTGSILEICEMRAKVGRVRRRSGALTFV